MVTLTSKDIFLFDIGKTKRIEWKEEEEWAMKLVILNGFTNISLLTKT